MNNAGFVDIEDAGVKLAEEDKDGNTKITYIDKCDNFSAILASKLYIGNEIDGANRELTTVKFFDSKHLTFQNDRSSKFEYMFFCPKEEKFNHNEIAMMKKILTNYEESIHFHGYVDGYFSFVKDINKKFDNVKESAIPTTSKSSRKRDRYIMIFKDGNPITFKFINTSAELNLAFTLALESNRKLAAIPEEEVEDKVEDEDEYKVEVEDEVEGKSEKKGENEDNSDM